jgi:hypothetical protein
MQILDQLRQAQGGAALARLGAAHGLSADEMDTVVAAVLPEFSVQLERNTLSRGGLADLINALGQGHHEAVLDDPAIMARPQTHADGVAILDHVLGSKDRSRALAARAEASTGISASIIKMLLPIIASMVMGGISKSVKGGLGDVLGRIGGAAPGGGSSMPPLPRTPRSQPAEPDGGGFPWPSPGAEPTNPMPQGGGSGRWGNTGGNPGDVRMNQGGGLEMPGGLPRDQPAPSGDWMGGGTRRGNPAPNGPVPADNPYGDLADILRRGIGIPKAGGQSAPRNPVPDGAEVGLPQTRIGGGMLWQIVRGVLGSALGFQGKGIVSWLIRMVVMRWGWGLLKTVLGRGVLGR